MDCITKYQKTVYEAKDVVDFTIEANQDYYVHRNNGLAYGAIIVDLTDQKILSSTFERNGIVTQREAYTIVGHDKPHQYQVVIGILENDNDYSLSAIKDIQARSEIITVARNPWKIGHQIEIQPLTYSYYDFYYRINMTSPQDFSQVPYGGRLYNITEKQFVSYNYNNAQVYPYSPVAAEYKWVFGQFHYDETGALALTYLESESPSFVLKASGGPTDPYETAGGSNLSENCVQNCHGDPINTATGEFWEANQDIIVPQNGPLLGLTRSFSTTKKDEDKGFGRGWTHNYNVTLRPTSTIQDVAPSDTLADANQIAVVQENGSEVVFSKLENGTYIAPARVKATLSKNDDGTFSFVRNKKDKFYFNVQGALVAIKDKNDNAVILSYNNSKELVKVANSRGQFIELIWSNGRISEVKDHTLRKVTYGYNSNGNLIKVTNPANTTREYTYDAFNRVASLENELGGKTHNTYYGDEDHRILKQTDPRGNVMSFTYGSNYTSITYPDGYNVVEMYNRHKQLNQKTENYNGIASTFTYEYSIDGFVSKITDPAQQVSYMTYNEDGNPTAVQDNAGNITRMTYDETGNLLTTTNAAGDVATMTYDANGNMTSSVSYEGRKTTYTINPDGTPASSVSPKGHAEGAKAADYTSTFVYANGYLASLIDANGNKNSIITDSLGRPVKTIGAKGNVVGANPDEYASYITYDTTGNITKTKDANGNENTSTYDAAGNVLTSTDPLGRVSTFTYDVMGNLLTSKDALGNQSSYEYDSRNRLVKLTDAKGKISEITYDQAGRVIKTKDAAGRETHQSWNSLHQLVSTTDAAGKVSEFTYDSLGNLKTAKNPLGHSSTFSYDALNRLKTTVDAENKSSTISYTKDSLVSSVLRPDGLSESSTYDLAGQPISSTNAAGKARTWSYNNLGQLTQYKDELAVPESYNYDVAGQVTSVTRTDGSVINKTYDNRGLLVAVDYPNTDMDISYTHDVLGRVVTEQKASDPAISYAYNEIGQLTSRGPPGKKVEYTYDELGNLKSLKYPSGRIVNYTVNDVSETTNLSTAGITDIAFSYSNRGQHVETTLPTGVKTSKSYDDAGQLTGINLDTGSSVNLYSKKYNYTPTGNVSQQGTAPDVPTLDDFTYDPMSRLTEQKKNVDGTSVNAYEYNAIGNLTKSNGTVQSFDDTGKILSSGVKTFGYDNAGNRTTEVNSADATKNVSYGWNNANLLTSVGVASKDIDYSYDASGFLSSRTKDGAVANEFIWDTNGSIPLLLDDGKYEYIYGIDRTPIAQILKSSGEVSYLHSDAIGSVVAKTSEQGTLTGETSYSPYGKPTGTPLSSFGYAGEWVDGDTGYTYLRARWLDTETGTFLSRDPAVQSTGDAYGYASGNPLRYIDPLGLCSVGNGDLGNLASNCYSFAESPAFLELNNFMAGVGDTASMGATKSIRELAGTNDQVNTCAVFYTAGEVTGTVASLITPIGTAKIGTAISKFAKSAIKTVKFNRLITHPVFSHPEAGYLKLSRYIKAPELTKSQKDAFRNQFDGKGFQTDTESWKVAKAMGFVRTNFFSDGAAVYSDKREKIFITRDIPNRGKDDAHNGGYWKLAYDNHRYLGKKGDPNDIQSRAGTYDMFFERRIGD